MPSVATLREKIETEHRMRELLEEHDLPQPDAVEYGYTCIRFYYHDAKTCLVIDIDELEGADPPLATG